MTKLVTAFAIMGLSLLTASAQSNSGGSVNHSTDLLISKGTATAGRARVVGSGERGGERREQRSDVTASNTQLSAGMKGDKPGPDHRSEAPDETPGTNSTPTAGSPAANVGAPATSMSQQYLVGVGDVLDVQLVDVPTRKSTLFTVREGGAIDYPLAGEPLVVSGLTAEEIAGRLRARIKVFENPTVVVKVRDYVSHSVIITGLVTDPGAKFLRREAMPLYVVLAEAQPRPEATSVTITRARQPAATVDLTDHQAMSVLVMPGDLIKVVGAAREAAGFFYAGGALNQPGQKVFHNGLTLTQAILASGGVARGASGKAKIARQGADGRLTTSEYNLRQIQDGKLADPLLQRGDRIIVAENR